LDTQPIVKVSDVLYPQFSVPGLDAMVGALVNAALFARANGRAGPAAGSKAAGMQLRLLGVDTARADAVASRSIASVNTAGRAIPI
jgi:hypothetical protein